MRTIRALLFFAAIFFLIGNLSAQDSTRTYYDQETRNWKQYDPERLQEFTSDPDFTYERSKADLNLWDRFWNWITEWISRIFKDAGDSTGINWNKVFKYLIYALGIFGVIYLIIKIIQGRLTGGFYGNYSSGQKYRLGEENIHEIDFRSDIEEAVNKGEFRKAIRLIYLFSLKQLSDKKMIEWELGKTNHEYLYELNNPEIQKYFSELGYFFEFTWYGGFSADRDIYEQTYSAFRDLEAKLSNEKV